MPPQIITDFSSANQDTQTEEKKEKIKLKKDTETSVEENEKSSFGSGGVYVPQTG